MEEVDALHTTTEVRFDWMDRIRILLRGRCWVRTKHVLGEVMTQRILRCESSVNVEPILPRPRSMVMGAEPEKE